MCRDQRPGNRLAPRFDETKTRWANVWLSLHGREVQHSASERIDMKLNKVIKRSQDLASPYCVSNGRQFRLKDIDPDDTGELKSEDKPRAKEALAVGVEALATLQDMLYAQDRWAVL